MDGHWIDFQNFGLSNRITAHWPTKDPPKNKRFLAQFKDLKIQKVSQLSALVRIEI
jgi:hypothetical protein